MNLQHSKTQAVQFFQVVTATQGVVHYRRFGPNDWEIQLGNGWEPASGTAVLEAAYRESWVRILNDSVQAPKIAHAIAPLPTEQRLSESLSREQQNLIADWLDEEISIYLKKQPNRSMSVYEHLGYLSARLRALANHQEP